MLLSLTYTTLLSLDNSGHW